MRKDHRKLNNAGGASCLLLLLLAFFAVNPIVGLSAFAEAGNSASNPTESNNTEELDNSIDDSYGGNAADLGSPAIAPDDSNTDIMTLAGIATSSVGISFSPAKYYTSLAPTPTGAPARIDITATVNVYNSGGYTVYLRSDSPNLVGAKSSSNVILGADTAKTYTDMDVNTWGYASREGLTVLDTDTYKAVAVSAPGDQLAVNNPEGDTNINHDTKTIALSFATKVNTEVAPDTYSNTMMLSVVSSPMKVVEIAYDYGGITNLQQMTTAICDAAPIGGVKQLRDSRDNKYYWIGKLDDGHCWMTQNLDLDLSTGTTLTPTTSDVSANWTPAYTTVTAVSSSTLLTDNTGQRSWSLGNYRITNPTIPNSCGYGAKNIATCATASTTNDRFTPYNTPTSADTTDAANAHYIVGNHYQWCAATAGCTNSDNESGDDFSDGQATSSICPKGWRLPTGGPSGEFKAFIDASPIGSSVAALASAPYYFVRGGYIFQTVADMLSNAGDYGFYWSSTAYTNTVSSDLYFYSTNYIEPADGYLRQIGRSVRCLAR